MVKKGNIKDCTCPFHKDGRCLNDNSIKGGGEAFYGFGLIGALIYFISVANGFWEGVLGILKAIVWPVFMVYEAFKLLLS